MNSFQNKNILFISVSFFGYQNEIFNSIVKRGGNVDLFDERPKNTFFTKALIRINRNSLGYLINKYYNKIINITQKRNYDYIFITKGESISSKSLIKLRKLHPKAKFILYLWDSIINNKNAIKNICYFDYVYSFDKNDCSRYNFRFLPLFYIDTYENNEIEEKKDIDLLFIGTIHSDRYNFIQKINKQILSYKLVSYYYMYFPSIILFYKMKFENKIPRKISKEEFHFKSLGKEDIAKYLRRSNIIIDIQHPKQTGLTMRSIETLGAKRKLITTNVSIKEYDFYNPNNILIIDRINPVIPMDFFTNPYEEVPLQIYKKYSLESWIETIFNS